MNPTVLVIMLALLLGMQPITTDLYLPALPTLTRDLGASVSGAQLTLSTLIICFGLAQLACGPLADRYGRRPILLGGLALYTLASIASALAPTLAMLVACRALQGAGIAAAVACGRSVVRDLYEPQEGARVMSAVLSGLGLIAMTSPLLGGLVVSNLGWRTTLLLPALFGAATLALVHLRFRETVRARDPHATRWRPLLANWRHVAVQPTFVAFTLLVSASYGGVFTMLAGSSFVLIELHGISRATYGLVLTGLSMFYVIGTFLCRALLSRLGLRRTVVIGGVLSLVGGVAMAALSIAGFHGLWAVLIPQCIFTLGHGIHQPCGQAGAVGPFPRLAGTAASLSGFVMMVFAFAVSVAMGRALNGTVYPLTLGVGFFGVLTAVTAFTLVQRHGEPRLMPRVAPAS